jgi:hypothetical protein
VLEAVDSIEFEVEGLVLLEQRVVRAWTEVLLPRMSRHNIADAFGDTNSHDDENYKTVSTTIYTQFEFNFKS